MSGYDSKMNALVRRYNKLYAQYLNELKGDSKKCFRIETEMHLIKLAIDNGSGFIIDEKILDGLDLATSLSCRCLINDECPI